MSRLNERNSVEALIRPLTAAESACLRCTLAKCNESHVNCGYRRAMRAAELDRRGGPVIARALFAEERAGDRRVERALAGMQRARSA